MTDPKYVNAYSLLQSLPGVVEARDIRVAVERQYGMAWEKKTANEAVFRWTKAGYLTPFSKEVYFNRVSTPGAPQSCVYDAAERSVRRAMVLVGASALNTGGWTTQMPSGHEIAVLTDRNIRTWKRMVGITGEARSVSWFARTKDRLIKTTGDFDRLPPALALVDAIASRERFRGLSDDVREAHLANGTVNWHPDPDDICMPLDSDPETMWGEIMEAAEILGVQQETVRDYARAIPDLEDVVSASSSPTQMPQPRY